MSLDNLVKKIIDQTFSLNKSINKNKIKSTNNITSKNESAESNQKTSLNTLSDKHNLTKILNSININFGTIRVTQNGIEVKGKRNKDVLAKLTPCQGITVFVNGTEVKETVEVSEDDVISIECHTENIPGNIDVEVYESEAYLNIRCGKIITYTLVEQPEQRNVTLQTKSEIKLVPFSEQEIYQRLQESEVKYGINYGLLHEIVIKQSEGRFLIASGKKPIPPEDDQIVVLFTEDITLNTLKDSSNIKIDINSIKSVPSVESGALLAVKKPGKEGIPGISVTGQPILPREPEKIELLAGEGTVLINEGNAVIASKPGRPIIRRGKNRWLVAIEDCLVVYGDVDISTGNQIFKGSIKIMGNVQDCLKVHAGGRIDIAGYCSKSEIIAMEHIKVKNIINSTVQAGIKSKHFVTCRENIRNLKKQLIDLTNAYQKLMPKIGALSSKEVREGYIILLLIENCFKDVPKLLRQTVDNFKILPMELPTFTTRLINMIQKNLPPIDLTIDKINTFIDAISSTEEFLFSDENTANIYTENVLTSYLACTGSIYVQGEGCINSKVISGDNIFINGAARGGLLSARADITVGELGSKSCVPIIVSSKEGKITVKQKAHAGVVLKIGSFKKAINHSTGPITAYANDNGIIIKSLLNTWD
ncbi:MAG: DUF342 domain-containing protein [Desulfotomaculum sp.]|nr:DUF342 domain-containing protein [Desulfotomaculum sp.]